MKNLIISKDLDASLSNRFIDFVKRYWDVFRERGVKIPVQGYEMVIDTGNHKPIAVKKAHYGFRESPIMQKALDLLIEMWFIVQDNMSPWGFNIKLALKPHQENVTDINEYIWRFCINYIFLNKITRPVEYPIPW